MLNLLTCVYINLCADGPGEKPGAATNLTLSQEAGGWVLRWLGPKEDTGIVYYTIQHKEDSKVNKQLE